jgi:xylan 1,4-beta-xylosidase
MSRLGGQGRTVITIQNPVLRGFNPDPSILRVDDDYYIATSTFEWFPGVCIYHSLDLAHWHLAARPLDRLDLLDMRGEPDSGGVWAPCLSWSDGLFYLVYSDVKRWEGQVKDCHNWLTTARSIEGPWSDPVYLDSSGFDASLFHDHDGTKWLVNMLWDYRPARSGFGGILLQEYSARQQRLTGESSLVFSGTSLGLVEGPHLYRRGAYYYLVTAEGGTFTTHAVTVARSSRLQGPYEPMPDNPLLTSMHDPALALQSAGHGSLVETRAGEWFLAHLARRPRARGRSLIGRETCLQRVEWTPDGWLRLAQGGRAPRETVEAADLPSRPWVAEPARDDFQSPALRSCYHSLRIPLDDSLMSLAERPGFLRLKGRESILSHFRQSMVARRITSYRVSATTSVEFEPGSFQHLAGMAAFYNTDCFYYLYISRADHAAKCVGIMRAERGVVSFPVEKEIPVEGWTRVFLGIDIEHARISFRYSRDGSLWTRAGWEMDSSILSDEHARPCGFTGTFIALCCQDLSGTGRAADFDFLECVEDGE